MFKITLLLIASGIIISSHPGYELRAQASQPEIYGAPDGLTGDVCEGIMMRLDFIAIEVDKVAKDQTVIIIARPGSGEAPRSFGRLRLKQAADYLSRRLERWRIVTAEGSGVKGLAQLDFYVAGKLHSVFKIRRNKDLVKGCGAEEQIRGAYFVCSLVVSC